MEEPPLISAVELPPKKREKLSLRELIQRRKQEGIKNDYLEQQEQLNKQKEVEEDFI